MSAVIIAIAKVPVFFSRSQHLLIRLISPELQDGLEAYATLLRHAQMIRRCYRMGSGISKVYIQLPICESAARVYYVIHDSHLPWCILIGVRTTCFDLTSEVSWSVNA